MQLTKTEAGKSPAIIDRSLTLELVRVTERAAIAAAGWRGKGDEKAADSAAVEAMRGELEKVRIDGRIVIGEAKVSDRLEPTQKQEIARCEALRNLAEDLSADEFVMATSGPQWHERTRKNVEERIGPAVTVRWLTDLR